MEPHEERSYHSPEPTCALHTHRRKDCVCSLTLTARVRLNPSVPMRTSLFALCALVMFVGSAADAAPRKKAAAAAAAKKPGGAPAVKLNTSLPTEEPAPPAEGAPTSMRGPTRIDFDDRLIQGQTNKSGAVYLYDRKELKIRSMIKKRDNFREEIVGSLYDS